MRNSFPAFMRAPCAIFKMLLAAGAYSVVTYLHYQSVQTALFHAVAAFVLLQVAYVGGIILLAWREQARIHGISSPMHPPSRR
jgi:nitrate reductase NapE component